MISGPNWARRYGPGHRRLCARPGCGAPAAATLRFQPTQREAWLVALDEARTEGDLCARHAAGLVLPRGWQLHNATRTRRLRPFAVPVARRSPALVAGALRTARYRCPDSARPPTPHSRVPSRRRTPNPSPHPHPRPPANRSRLRSLQK